jgi:hypothetical protein
VKLPKEDVEHEVTGNGWLVVLELKGFKLSFVVRVSWRFRDIGFALVCIYTSVFEVDLLEQGMAECNEQGFGVHNGTMVKTFMTA